ncbi:hypothetical protein, partial [Neisseria sp. P0014.S006]|uniref:hypothetical protein n=1 Tax=Neisseria sp. P0014.S006 TaxID=3436752 RepID=UPI003F802D8B
LSLPYTVSTHRRLKAAGRTEHGFFQTNISFNTQPPEGGWPHRPVGQGGTQKVSTHSRLKAAG